MFAVADGSRLLAIPHIMPAILRGELLVDSQQLMHAAQRAMQAGRMAEAERLLLEFLRLSPNHPQALFHLAQVRLSQSNAAEAIQLFEQAERADAKTPAIPFNLAFAYRAQGDVARELKALDRALTLDPYYLPALFAKGQAAERAGKIRQAARIYKDALSIAPPDDQLQPNLQKAAERARTVVAENAEKLERHIDAALAAIRRQHGEAGLHRFETCREALLGNKKIYTHRPTMLHYPELPAIQFYDRHQFSWIQQLEAATDDIRTELLAVLESARSDEPAEEFRPYVQHPAGVPLNQWEALNHSPRWGAYFLWDDGKRIDSHCARCPKTAAVAESMPLARIPGYAPAVFFSLLAPHTRIPPHTGVTNIRLVVHLPLIVPEGCGFRVGNDSRGVEPGKAWVFDDTIEHEAWNDSGQNRYILIFDIWNPLLSPVERELATSLLTAMGTYYSGE
jgi:aspartyl/asparaginyl beta-hydroxylase (cupin superfamily)/Flp pilus assembly protein TadD